MGGSESKGVAASTVSTDVTSQGTEPHEPCHACGSALFWYRKARGKSRAECCGCHREPSNPFMRKAVLIVGDDGVVRLVDFEQERSQRRREAAGPFADWVQKPDVDGKMGWEPPDLPQCSRWWAHKPLYQRSAECTADADKQFKTKHPE